MLIMLNVTKSLDWRRYKRKTL